MANVGVQRVLRLLVFTETQLSARFLHFVIIFCQKMAFFPCNVREARLSACHLKRSMCYWGRRILAYFCLFMLFMEHAVLRYESFVRWPVCGVCCAPLRVLLCIFVVVLVHGVHCAPLRHFVAISA